jgi:hypothetical protein
MVSPLRWRSFSKACSLLLDSLKSPVAPYAICPCALATGTRLQPNAHRANQRATRTRLALAYFISRGRRLDSKLPPERSLRRTNAWEAPGGCQRV